MTKPLVLVTGASGFIALHCIVQLLEQGYQVRGTVRGADREGEVREAVKRQIDAADRLSFAHADLNKDDGWPEAVAGCDFVLHVASPFPADVPKNEDELIKPARDGALRVLHAAAAAGVRRVVLTSSTAAVAYGHVADGKVFDENDWSDLSSPNIGAYEKSKTLAERAAWDFVAGPDAKGLELSVINPGAVMGPLLSARTGTSAEIVRRLMTRDIPACPRIGFAMVDVRDVASAHILAMTNPAAAGQRFCCVNGYAWFNEIAEILATEYNHQGYRVPTKIMPNFIVKIAALFDPALRLITGRLGQKADVSNKLITDVLGWKPHSIPEMTIAMAESMIEFGVTAKPSK
jgi:nucleoside-diphosphate-sugar epimerase